MKKNIILVFLYGCVVIANAQQRNLIVNTNINNSGCLEDVRKGRDEVRFKPNTSNDNIRITACPNDASKSVRLKTDETLLPVMNGNGNDQYVSESSLTKDSPISTGLEVGGSGGTVNVSPAGGAAYSFSFALPAAGGGVTPSLGLVYNSLARNGIVGWGWNIAGISAITRVGKDMYHDNYVGAVHVNSRNELNQYGEDRFSLDGQRLVATNTYTCYGEDNMQFETEVRSNSKIISHAEACGSYPHNNWSGAQWFEVIREDGTVLEYGKENNSRLYPHANNGTLKGIMTWYLNKQTDIYGNVIEYKYTYNDFGVVVLSKILYGFNINKPNQIATNEITLFYSSKNNSIDNLYVNQTGSTNWSGAGLALPERWNLTNQLLEKVTIATLGEKVHEYKLNYAFDGHTSRLKYITQKLKDGTELNAVVFDYSVPTVNDNVTTGQNFNILTSSSDYRQMAYADLNGDGIKELIIADPKGSNERNIKIYKLNISDGIYTSFSFISKKINNYNHFQIGDFNGDGKDDILVANSVSTGAFYFDDNLKIVGAGHNFGVQISSNYKNVLVGDFDGDGKSDFISLDNNNKINKYFFGKNGDNSVASCSDNRCATLFAEPYEHNQTNLRYLAQDFDGDGRTELLISKPGGSTYIYKMHDDNKFYAQDFNTGNVASYIGANDQIFPGDYNGDGKMDILVDRKSNQTKHQLSIIYATANGYYTNPVALQGGRLSPVPWQSNVNIEVGDFNGDGKTDIMSMWNDQQGPPNGSNTGFNADFYFSDGGVQPTFTHGKSYNTSGWHAKIVFDTEIPKNSISNVVLSDIDNNGTTDIIYDDDNVNNSSGVVVLFPNLVSSKLLTGIRDGIGNKTTIEYAPLRYGSGNDAFYINEGGRGITDAIGIALPFRAVKKISQPNGVGGLHDITYQYSGAAMHKLGKGFLGFHSITTKDALNNTKQVSTTEINAPITRHPVQKRNLIITPLKLQNQPQNTPLINFILAPLAKNLG